MNHITAIALIPFLFFSATTCFFLLLSAFWIWMLVDCALHEENAGSAKVVWILIILFTHVLGATIYFFVRKLSRGPSAY